MITAMTHMDSDGVISLSLFLKKIGGARIRVYFTSPVQLRDTICRSVLHLKNLGELYIFDLAGENKAVYAASIYDRVVWIDHHDWEPENKPEHVEIIIDKKAKSAARVVARYFNLDSFLVDLADQIDSNSVKDEDAEKIRTVIGALRYGFSGVELNRKLYKFARELMNEDLSVLESYKNIVDKYTKWLEKVIENVKKGTKIFHVADMKVAIYETMEAVPVYLISNEIDDDVDIIVILIHWLGKEKPTTKLEFRTHTDVDVLKIAKFFGGGGHKKASGASVRDIVTIPEVLKAIELLYT